MNKPTKQAAKNPIGLVAIFSGISEISMTVVLLRLPEEQMKIFIWFVMLFPILLVGSFFCILYKKPEVLYAPSDYKNDGTFLKSIGIENEVTEIADKVERLDQLGIVLKDYMEKLVEQVAPEQSEQIIEEQNTKFTEVNLFHSLQKNNLFGFMHLELGMTPDRIFETIRNTPTVRDLADHVLKMTGDLNKKERLSRVIERFPRAHIDFVNLKKEADL